jgi:lipopolysaccharide transport system permease protein
MSSYTIHTVHQHPYQRYWQLLSALTSRDIKSRYRRTVLGPTWSLLQPFILMVIFVLLQQILNIETGGPSAIIFVYSVLVPWTFFANAVGKAAPSVISNGSIIKKTRVPRELFPLVAILTSGFDTLMASLILVAMMLWFGVALGLHLLWVFPLFLLTALLALSVGMLFAALGVFKRDILQANGFILQLWLYASPIIYPLDKVPSEWLWAYRLNPTVGLMEGFRNVLALGQAPDLGLLAWSLPALGLILVVSWGLFRYTSQYFADVL